MAKKKKEPTALEKEGFKLVEGTAGQILDSIWHNEETDELRIIFAVGRILKVKIK